MLPLLIQPSITQYMPSVSSLSAGPFWRPPRTLTPTLLTRANVVAPPIRAPSGGQGGQAGPGAAHQHEDEPRHGGGAEGDQGAAGGGPGAGVSVRLCRATKPVLRFAFWLSPVSSSKNVPASG